MAPFLAALLVIGIVLVMLITAGVPAPIITRRHSSADDRAETLLRKVLTVGEHNQLDRDGYLEVVSPTHPGRVYHVPPNRRPVTVLENGSQLAYLCLQSTEHLPGREIVVAHKLMLEADETGYWSQANLLPRGLGRSAY